MLTLERVRPLEGNRGEIAIPSLSIGVDLQHAKKQVWMRLEGSLTAVTLTPINTDQRDRGEIDRQTWQRSLRSGPSQCRHRPGWEAVDVYHQQNSEKIGWQRFLAIDPLWFDEQGVIHTKTTRDTDEPAP